MSDDTTRAELERVFSGSTFEADIGYARAVADDNYVFVSGTTGYDYATMQISPDPVAQAEQACRNIAAALAEVGADHADVVRVKYVFVDRDDFAPCWPVLRRFFGVAPPAATMIVAGLYDEAMKLEIEVTARRPGATAGRQSRP